MHLLRRDEARADPHGGRAQGEAHREATPVEDAAGGDDVDGAAVQRRRAPLALVDLERGRAARGRQREQSSGGRQRGGQQRGSEGARAWESRERARAWEDGGMGSVVSTAPESASAGAIA
eukprot:810315-Prymnesium_polylepis.1